MQLFDLKVRVFKTDEHTHKVWGFEVPDNIKGLQVEFKYAPKISDSDDTAEVVELLKKEVPEGEFSVEKIRRDFLPLKNHIGFSLDAPDGWAGTAHKHDPLQSYEISKEFSSPGFRPVEVFEGSWQITLSFNAVVTDFVDIEVKVEGVLAENVCDKAASTMNGRVASDVSDDMKKETEIENEKDENEAKEGGKGKETTTDAAEESSTDAFLPALKYYKAEMHTHTVYSDGSMTPEELVDRAVMRGYDAIVVSDHNNIFGVTKAAAHATEKPIVVVPGIEWTTFFGHIVVTGGKSRVDWRCLNLKNINEKITKACDSGDAVTLAHPFRLGGHLCTGCRNYYDIKAWDKVAAVEVWTERVPHMKRENVQTKQFWLDLLEKGHKIAAVYGYDWHNSDEKIPVYAATYFGTDKGVSRDSIVEALKKGRTYISMGVRLSVLVLTAAGEFSIGDTAKAGKAKIVLEIEKEADFCKRYRVEATGVRLRGSAVRDTAGKARESVIEKASHAVEKAEGVFCDISDGKCRVEIEAELKKGFFIVELLGQAGGVKGEVALTSPIYVEE